MSAAEPDPTPPPSKGSASASAAAEPRWALEPDAARIAQRLGQIASTTLDRPLSGIALDRDSVTVRLAGEPPWTLVFRHEPSEGTVRTSHGALRLPDSLDDAAKSRLIAALDAQRPTLPWRSISAPPLLSPYPLDVGAAERVRVARRRSRDARSPGAGPAPTEGATEATASQPDARRLAAEAGAIRQLGLSDPEPSASLGSIEASLRTTRDAPKLWAAAAFEALRQGQPTQALAYADVATRMGRLDADALAAWSAALDRPPTPLPPDAVPALLPHPQRERLPPLALWLALAALLWFAAARSVRPAGTTRQWVVASIALGALGYLASDARPPAATPVPPLPDAWLAPLAGGPCDAAPPLWTEAGWLILATCDGAPTSFLVAAHAVGEAASESSGTAFKIDATSDRPGPVVDAAARHLRSLAADTPPPGATRPRDAEAPAVTHTPADRAERRLTATLAAASLPALAFLFFTAFTSLFRAARADRALALALALAVAITVLTRTLTPARLVMEYTGYDLTARLASLAPLPRYGGGALWLYGPALDLFGVDHRHIQWTNRLLGALTLLPLTALTFHLSRHSRVATATVALLFAALPVFWRDHSAEGIQTGTTFLLVSALAALAAEPRARLPAGPVLALPLLAWAAACRPEVVGALPFATAAILLSHSAAPSLRRATLALCAAALTTALLPHVAWLASSAARQLAETGIAGPRASLERIPGVLVERNIFLDGPWLPAACLVWLAAAFATSGRRLATPILLALAAATWLAMTAVDLPRISIPRVHLPALCLLLPLVGLGAARLHRWPAITWLLAAAVIASSLARAPAILATGNADAEEALIRSAQSLTQRHPKSCVATVSSADPPPPGKTPRHFPRYLFAGHPITGLDELTTRRSRCPGPAIAILGTRCYMAERDPHAAPPPAPGRLDVCQRFAAAHRLTPFTRADIPNLTVGTFPMYPAAPTLDVGVYVVESSERATP